MEASREIQAPAALADELRLAGRHEEALEAYRAASDAAPGDPDILHDLGALLTLVGQLREGEAVLRQAIALRPSPMTQHALALTLAALGRYPEAWSYYRARHEIPGLDLPMPAAFPFPEWRGENLAGKRIAVFPEQGYGDQIMFARFVPQLQALGAGVTLLARPALVRLFAHSFPGAEVVPAVGEAVFSDPDFWTMSGALVGGLGATVDTIPRAPYLQAPRPCSPLTGGLKIGLVTSGNPAHANDAERSLHADAAARLRATLPGHVISLDPAETGAQDFADTAALIEQLDAVVSVDTSVAHLAGAMGRPCFVLLPSIGTDWRWMHERRDSPWYPTMRLYRRAPREGWDGAIRELASDVGALSAPRER